MNSWLILYIISYIASFITIFGWSFAFWQKKFPFISKEDAVIDFYFSIFAALCFSIFSIVGVLVGYYLTEKAKYGWKIR